MENFYATFEYRAIVCRRLQKDWTIRLVLVLNGKTCSAWVAIHVNESGGYGFVKEAITKKYCINAESFHSVEVLAEETPKRTEHSAEEPCTFRWGNLYIQSRKLCLKWVKPAGKMVQEIEQKDQINSSWKVLYIKHFYIRLYNTS